MPHPQVPAPDPERRSGWKLQERRRAGTRRYRWNRWKRERPRRNRWCLPWPYPRNQFQRRVEACGITECEELFGVCTIARATHFFGYGHFEVDAAVGKVCLAVARVTDGECFCGVEGFHRAFLSCFLNKHRLSYVRPPHPRAAFDRSVTHAKINILQFYYSCDLDTIRAVRYACIFCSKNSGVSGRGFNLSAHGRPGCKVSQIGRIPEYLPLPGS